MGARERRAAAAVPLFLLVAGCLPLTSGRRIDVGGHRLRFHNAGQGGPAVVFDAGLGDGLDSWEWVWPRVAKTTRIVVYDRAGLGKSDAGPLPRTSGQIVDELRTLLSRAEIRPPYVLVGHSFGALNAWLFAARHPQDVAGLVLVDATPLDFPFREAALRADEARLRMETAVALGPPALEQEWLAVRESVAQIRAAGRPPSIPVFVVSSTRPAASPEFRKAWISMQRDLVRELGAVEHVVAERSGHYIQFDEPDLVVQAILDCVRRVRAGAG